MTEKIFQSVILIKFGAGAPWKLGRMLKVASQLSGGLFDIILINILFCQKLCTVPQVHLTQLVLLSQGVLSTEPGKAWNFVGKIPGLERMKLWEGGLEKPGILLNLINKRKICNLSILKFSHEFHANL